MRLIDADAFDERIRQAVGMTGEDLTEDFKDGVLTVLRMLKDQPTIEPERKKGRWIEQDDAWDGVYYECSCCKEPFTLIDGTPSDNLYNFCPACGADMRGEQNA